MNIKCFLLVETGFTYRYLRRYVSGDKCPGSMGYHNAACFIDKGLIGEASTDCSRDLDKADPRWPTQCECGYVFTDQDEWQLFVEIEYRRTDTGDLHTLSSAPVGAIWRAEWFEDAPSYCGTDGKSYVVKTPGGDWMIDSKASNCTRPDDHVHKCWCRHGEAPNFTVDKNGNTCSAGAGSIQQKGYHGFLRNGELTNC